MASKLGPHVIQATSAAQAWATHAPLVKQLDGTTCLRLAPAGSLRVFRAYWPDGEMNARIASMAVAATVADIVQALGGFVPDYVDGPFNEVAQRQGLGLEQHADFMAAFVPAIKAALPGVKVSGFAFSTGNPGSAAFGDRDDFQYLYNRNWCGCDAISLHCYFGTDGFDSAYALRWRALCSTVPSHPPIMISECGIDAVPGGAKGWMAAGLSAAEYVDLLAAYDAELAKDDDVIGATVFTAGASNDWAAYNTDPCDTSRFWIGGIPMASPSTPTIEDRVAALEQRDALITQALHRILTGDYTGASGAAADVVALQGGQDDLSGSVKVPTF